MSDVKWDEIQPLEVSQEAIEQSILLLQKAGWMQEHDRILTEGEWIPCTERLPDMGEEVWVTADSATYIATLKERKTTFGDYIQEWWTEDDWIFQFEEVTAWRPLYRPQPYKGE